MEPDLEAGSAIDLDAGSEYVDLGIVDADPAPPVHRHPRKSSFFEENAARDRHHGRLNEGVHGVTSLAAVLEQDETSAERSSVGPTMKPLHVPLAIAY